MNHIEAIEAITEQIDTLKRSQNPLDPTVDFWAIQADIDALEREQRQAFRDAGGFTGWNQRNR